MSNQRNRRRRAARPLPGGEPQTLLEPAQAAADPIPLVVRGQTVGEFRPAPTRPLWAMVKFAAAARNGITVEDVAGMGAIYDLVRASVHDDDWPTLQLALDKHQPDLDDLFALAGAAYAVSRRRPTAPPSGASGGRSTTPATSAAASSSPGTIPPGRPDLQLVAQMVPVEELVAASG